jgi:8-oxo-dGTP pyrophosphatase MutT (NUDIX family)
MPTPDFVLALRRRMGHAPLWLMGTTAVVVHQERVLLGRRTDNGALTPITGIIDPREEPADAAAREAFEEAGVVITVDRLAWIHVIPRVTYDNGDQTDYLDLTFRCSWVSGDPRPVDGEMTDLHWFPVDAIDDLIDLDADMRERIRRALADGPADFEGGR